MAHPEKIIEVYKNLSNKEQLGFTFEGFLKYDSKESYVNELAIRAAKKYNEGKINVI